MSVASATQVPLSKSIDTAGRSAGNIADAIHAASSCGEDRSAGICLFAIFAGSFSIGIAVIGVAVLYVVYAA
ncbi:MAG: hypothetical protein K8U03_07045 [Planctomycetia bacterium]|nr:hypothetical protein [Planctomycetia bacterium]